MRKSKFESELHISPKWVSAALVPLVLALFLLADSLSDPSEWVPVVLLAMLIFAASAVAWALDDWKSRGGRWFTVMSLIVIVHLGNRWLDVPGLLPLLAIPTALAAVLIDLPAATATAVGETIWIVLWPRITPTGASWATVLVALIAIWAALGVMYAAYRPVHQVAQWSWEYFERAHDLLEEARDRQVKLKQALDDLADANLQLRRLNILAQGLRQAAEDARTAKEQFVANVSHELRTPLNMIVGFSEMILQSPETYGDRIPPALLADLAVIERNAEHLSDLIDDVLDLSQIEAEEMALTKEHVRFQELVEVAATAVRPLYDSKGLYLEIQVPQDLPTVFCDRTRIREVLLNLLSNAGRFTERGGVHIRAWQEGNDIAVAIADTGSGIAAKDMRKLFQPFQQVDGSIRRRYGGTGLGLCISKRYIELHGGKIWVESKKGVGTTFFFRLPVALPLPMSGDFARWLTPDWEYLGRTHPSTAPQAVVRPRFVIHETGNALQRLLGRYRDGVETVRATSLEKALEELVRVPAQALLINGASVSKELERLSASKVLPNGTPAIICAVPDTSQSAGALGASDYLVKPVSRETLLGALDRLNLEEGTILIVDDEPDALQLFGRMLASSERAYHVLLARDGQEATAILRDHRPDVILLDLVMPNMDGFQFLERKSQDPALYDIPIVVISARDPAGQPIVSNALAITCGNGLSVNQLLTSIEAVSRIVSATGPVGDPTPTRVQLDSLACG